MGEEEKKPEEEKMVEKITEEVKKKKPEEEKKEEPKAEKPSEEKKTEESKEPPPPQEIVLRVFMHCEGCARKVRRCLKGFEGVEDVQTDCKTHKVVVKGEKADPVKVLQRVQRKSHRQVELLSPIPKPPADEPKAEEKETPKPEENKLEEPQVVTVVLKVHMHCEACAQEIKKRIQRIKGVESAVPDLKSSQVTVKGVFDPPQLVEYVYKRTGKHAVIVKQDPDNKKEEDKAKEEKKAEEPAAASAEKKEGGEEGVKAEEKKDGGGDEAPAVVAKPEVAGEEETKVSEMKNEFQYYIYPQNYQIEPQRFATELYASSYPPPPQMFSDENPNACSVM